MTKWILCALCVAAAAAVSAGATPPQAGTAAAIAGRWQGQSYIAAERADCSGRACTLTLDIVACGKGWCGIEVASDNSCAGTALRLDEGEEGGSTTVFKGRLELARGTEPYIVQAYLLPAMGEAAETLEIQGDTGGEFRIFRRSFPFNAHLVRAGEAVCRTEEKISAAY